MKEYVNYIREINRIHWGNGPYQWIFYLGIILILLFEKKRIVRIVFAWLPIAYLMAIFIPLFHQLLDYAGVGQWTYHVRMFSFMPLLYSMAHGITLFSEKLKHLWKFVFIIAVCAAIALTGTNVYKQDWMAIAQNTEKIPDDVFEIKQMFSDTDKRVAIASYTPISVYLRQEAPEFITPYARQTTELCDLLTSSPTEVIEIMSLAGQQAMDYIVVPVDSEDSYTMLGYSPYGKTTNSLVYAVSGVERIDQVINENNQVIERTAYDQEGNKDPKIWGYATERYEYDKNGFISKIMYFDENGEPYERYNSFASIEFENSPRGLVKSKYFRDKNMNPAYCDGYISIGYEYDQRGRSNRETYYDAEGAPTNLKGENYASKRIIRNGSDFEEIYYDIEGKRTLCKAGYAALERLYNDEGQVRAERYYGLQGELLLETSAEVPGNEECMLYPKMTEGTYRIENDTVVFTLNDDPDNQIWNIQLQVFDATMSECLFQIGTVDELGPYSGVYNHQFDDGLYNLRLKVNTSRRDEYIYSLEYFHKGDMLSYYFNVDEMSQRRAQISGLRFHRDQENTLYKEIS